MLCISNQTQKIFRNTCKFWMSIDITVRLKASMSKLRWLKKDLRNSNSNIMSKNFRNWFSTKLSKKRSVSKLIFNNINSSTSNGMRTFSKPSKKTPKPLDPLKIDTPKKSSKTDKFLTRSFHWLSNLVPNYLISKRCKLTWLNKRTIKKLTRCKSFAKS